MSAGMTLSYADLVSPKARAFIDGMTDRTRLNKFIEGRAFTTTRDYLVDQAQKRHATANRLGASPTGHLSAAAESVTSTSDATNITLTVISPGFSRVAHDVTITPGDGKNNLTIPANSAAYGKRAAEVARVYGDLRFIPFKSGAKALAIDHGTGKDRQTIVFYWLVPSVILKQDRTLLPSDQTYGETLTAGAKDYFNARWAAQDSNYGGLLS